MTTTYKRGNEIPTIDVALVTMEVSGQENEIALDTASTIEVNPTSETEDAVQLPLCPAARPEQAPGNICRSQDSAARDLCALSGGVSRCLTCGSDAQRRLIFRY